MTHPVESALGDRAIFESGALDVLLEAMQDGVIITTAQLDEPGPVIIFVNKAFERMTGYNRREVAGRNPRIFQGPETSRAELDRMREALSAGGTFEGATINYRKNGEPFSLGWSVVPIFNDFGDQVAWLSLQSEAQLRGEGLAPRAIALTQGLKTNSADKSAQLPGSGSADLGDSDQQTCVDDSQAIPR